MLLLRDVPLPSTSNEDQEDIDLVDQEGLDLESLQETLQLCSQTKDDEEDDCDSEKVLPTKKTGRVSQLFRDEEDDCDY